MLIHPKTILNKFIVVIQTLKTGVYILVCTLTARLFPSRQKTNNNELYWLIGENYGQCIFDNGYYFYEYCLKTMHRENVYFVAKKQTLEKLDLPDILRKNALDYGSYKHIRILLKSQVLIFSHSPRDLINPLIHKIVFKDQYTVFLDHGIFALKRANADQHSFAKFLDVFVASSEWERDIIQSNFNIQPEKIKITGLARYDALENKCPESPKEILYIPTWRSWLDQNQPDPPYSQSIIDFLSSVELENCVKKFDASVTVWFHKSMVEQCKNIANKVNFNHVKFAQNGSRTVQQLIQESHIMITDYSSVSWDFAYLRKPVLFFQFDRDEFLKKKGSYIDLSSPPVGYATTSAADIIEKLDSLLSGGPFPVIPEFEAAYSFRDKANRSRLYNVVDKGNSGKAFLSNASQG